MWAEGRGLARCSQGAVGMGAQPQTQGHPSRTIPVVEKPWVGPGHGELVLSKQHFPSPGVGMHSVGKLWDAAVTPGTGTQLGCEQLPCVHQRRDTEQK